MPPALRCSCVLCQPERPEVSVPAKSLRGAGAGGGGEEVRRAEPKENCSCLPAGAQEAAAGC